MSVLSLRRLGTVVLAASATLLVAGACRSEAEGPATTEPDQHVVADSDTEPLRATGTMASTPTVASTYTATGVDPASLYWSGLTSIEASGEPVTLLAATALTDGRVRDATVLMARTGIDGLNGSTQGQMPGGSDAGLTGSARQARGIEVTGDEPWAVYVIGRLDEGADSGALLGADLRVQTRSGERTVRVMSPTQLCPDPPTVAPDGTPQLSERCHRFQTEFDDLLRTTFDLKE